jgi:hypothetical protein
MIVRASSRGQRSLVQTASPAPEIREPCRAFGFGLIQIVPAPAGIAVRNRERRVISSVPRGGRAERHAEGRLGLDDTRVPQKSRNGLVYVERARVAVDTGSLVLVFDEARERIELPYQRINALLLGPGTTVTHDAVRHCSAHGTAIAFVGMAGMNPTGQRLGDRGVSRPCTRRDEPITDATSHNALALPLHTQG